MLTLREIQEGGEKLFSIGEVSKMTKLSVRTLRYYDEIGLLKPSSYTEGNHRLYTEKDVVVLRKIMFLKKFGFSLQKIKEQLQGETDWEQFLQFQYICLKKEKQKIEHMMQGIESVMRSYQVEGEGINHSPQSPEVQKVVRNIIQKSASMFGNDPEKMEKAWEMSKAPKPEYRFYPIDEEIIQFLDKAFQEYDKIRISDCF